MEDGSSSHLTICLSASTVAQPPSPTHYTESRLFPGIGGAFTPLSHPVRYLKTTPARMSPQGNRTHGYPAIPPVSKTLPAKYGEGGGYRYDVDIATWSNAMTHPEWATYLRALLILHITCGVVAFLCAPVALVTAKGARLHRLFGKVYFWAMAGVAVTALTLSFALPIYFLAMVAVFSFYSAFAAYRVLSLKNLYKGARPRAVDWLAATVTVASSLLLFLMGFLRPALMGVGVISVAGHTVSIVSVVFGILGMRMGLGSLHGFIRPSPEKLSWWFVHMQGMIGSYIAALTAFSAVNLTRQFGPAWWVWLWPTIVGVPAIALWTAFYRKKFAPKPKVAVV